VIRSLGRAGYRVHAVSDRPEALGLHSRFATESVVSPPYSDPAYQDWLQRELRERDIAVIVPSEGFLVATWASFADLQPLMPVPDDPVVVRRCFSKAETTAAFLSARDPVLRDRLPPSVVVERGGPAPSLEALAALGLPLFLKGDANRALDGGDGLVRRIADPQAAHSGVEDLLERFDAVLVQGGVVGRKATVNVCLRRGTLLAASMCLATHESPHSGGLTVLRHTWWHEGMYQDALARLEYLGWDGVAMVEYKWDDAREEFVFIEANTRFWAALHLDLFAGTDFPAIQVDAFVGHPVQPAPRQASNVVSRHTVPGDVGYLMSRVRDPAVSLASRAWSLIEFCLLFMRPDIHRDLWFPGDRALYWRQWRQFLAGLFRPEPVN